MSTSSNDLVSYSKVKLVAMAPKMGLLLITPTIAFLALSNESAVRLLFLINALGYLELLSPGRMSYAIDKFSVVSSDRPGATEDKRKETFRSAIEWAESGKILLVVMPLCIASVYSLVSFSNAIEVLLAFLLAFLAIVNNYLLGYKSLIYALLRPSVIYRIQRRFALCAAFFTLLAIALVGLLTGLNLKIQIGVIVVSWYLGWIIFYLGTIYSGIRCRQQILDFIFSTVGSSEYGKSFELRRLKDWNSLRSVSYFNWRPGYLQLNVLLNMIVLGFLPFYFAGTATKSAFESMLIILPWVQLAPSILGSLYYERFFSLLQRDYRADGRILTSSGRRFIRFAPIALCCFSGVVGIVLFTASSSLSGLSLLRLDTIIIAGLISLVQAPQIVFVPFLYSIKKHSAVTVSLVCALIFTVLMLAGNREVSGLNQLGFEVTLGEYLGVHLIYNLILICFIIRSRQAAGFLSPN